MRKKIVLAMLMAFVLAGCGSKSAENETPVQNETQESVIEEEKELKETPESKESSESDETSESADTSEPAEGEEEENEVSDTGDVENYFSKATTIQQGETVQAGDVVKFSLDEVYWSKTVEPDSTESSYSSIENSQGIPYLIFRGSIENSGEETIDMSTFQVGDIIPYIALIKYGEKNYLAKLATATGENDNTNTRVEPQEKVPLYLFAAIPEEEKGKTDSAEMLMGFSDLQETISSAVVGPLTIEWDKCEYLYTAEFDGIGEK